MFSFESMGLSEHNKAFGCGYTTKCGGTVTHSGALQSALGTSEQLPGPWGLSALINVG